jgi:hypothetical protein
LHQAREGIRAVDAVRLGAEVIQRGDLAATADFVDSATATVTVVVAPALESCPIEVSVGSLNQASKDEIAVVPIEAM